MRDLTGPTQGRAIRDLLQSLFVAEALAPSDPLWLLSGWISDIPIVDNRSGSFSDVDAGWPLAPVPLSVVLRTIVARGGSINVILRDTDQNRSFVQRLCSIRSSQSDRLQILLAPDFHEKAIVGADYELAGSMNFTHRGVEVNDEHLIFRTKQSTVAARRLTLERRWLGRFGRFDARY